MFRNFDSFIGVKSIRPIVRGAIFYRRGLSYVVGVLLVLGVTLVAVVVFTQVLGFQHGVLAGLQALDVRIVGESLVPVEGVSKAGDIVVYNNGLIPSCFLEVQVVGTA